MTNKLQITKRFLVTYTSILNLHDHFMHWVLIIFVRKWSNGAKMAIPLYSLRVKILIVIDFFFYDFDRSSYSKTYASIIYFFLLHNSLL
jgi:hypothetical protein